MVTIKPLETEDEIRSKAYVHWQAWKETYTGLIDQKFLDSRTVEMSEKIAFRAYENGYPTILAKDGNRVIGFADYGPCRNEDLSDAGEVYAIYILKAYYGQGVGHALMRKALEALKQYRQVAVWVLEGNARAIRFYTRCGFRFDGKKQELALGTPVTEARMVLNGRFKAFSKGNDGSVRLCGL